jgi:hypothetical protein
MISSGTWGTWGNKAELNSVARVITANHALFPLIGDFPRIQENYPAFISAECGRGSLARSRTNFEGAVEVACLIRLGGRE